MCPYLVCVFLELDINKKDELLIGANQALMQLNSDNEHLKQQIYNLNKQLKEEFTNRHNNTHEIDALSKQLSEIELKLSNYSGKITSY